jgi:uncharacterized protein YjbI with pentapeptide repeats
MKSFISVSAFGFAIVSGCIQVASAAVMWGRAYEPFDYPDSPAPANQIIAANNLNGGTGWNFGGVDLPNATISNWDNPVVLPSASGQSTGRTITSPGLTYTALGYPESVGNKATVDAVADTNRVFRHIGQLVDNGTFYFSFLTERNNDTLRTTQLAFFGPANGIVGTPGNTPERVAIGQIGVATAGAGGTNGNFGLLINNVNTATNSSGVVNALNPIPYGTNVTHLVVGRVDFNPVGNETFTLYVDPTDVTAEPDTPYIQTSAFELTSVNSIRLFSGNAATINGIANPAASADFDEIRISSSWSDLFSNVPVPLAPFSIFKWQYIDPSNPSLGKQPSTTLTPDGYGRHAEPGIQAIYANLASAYLGGADLTNSSFNSAILTRAALEQADFTGADLSGANLTGANLSGAVLTDAVVKNAKLSSTHITLDQLYSTASYKDHDLTGVQFVGNDLSGANLTGQVLASTSFYAAKLVGADLTNADLTGAELVNADLSEANLTGVNFTNGTVALANLSGANLTNANLSGANFIGANLTGADIRGASLSRIVTTSGGASDGNVCHWTGLGCTPPSTTYIAGTGITLAQLASTASYGAGDLSAVTLLNSSFNGGNFAGFKLTNANFNGTTLVGADLSGADARGAIGLSGFAAPNLIRPDGHVAGLNLIAGQTLSIRDYDGSSSIPITVDQQLIMASGATLRMVFDADAWGSTLSFAPGIPVTLGATLELAFEPDLDLLSQIGRTFHVFDWTGVAPTGTFAVASPYAWDLSHLFTTGEVTFLASSGLAGDFNGDGSVNSADYTVWRNGLGAVYTQAAFAVWKNHFGTANGFGGIAALRSPAIPEPTAILMLTVGLVAAWMMLRTRPTHAFTPPLAPACRLLPILTLLILSCDQALAAPPEIQLTKIGAPVWKPVDFQLFSAPATPFDQEFGQVYGALLPYDTPLATTYIPHAPPYDTELSAGMIAGGYVSQSVFTPDAITLHPNGVYFAYMLVPAPGITGSSRDFAAGPVIPNSLFPLAANYDVWLDGVLVDRAPGADAITPVQPRDVGHDGTSHLESLQVFWHPWDDDLTVGPLGSYDLRASLRDVGGSGWDIVAQFRVAFPGDYDYNGTVGPEDYAVWKANFGSTTNLDADGNGDGRVNAADYTVWRNNLGASLPGSGSAGASPSHIGVPEPPALALAAVGLVSLIALLRRKPWPSGRRAPPAEGGRF